MTDVHRNGGPCGPRFIPIHRGSNHAAGARTDVLVGVIVAAGLIVGRVRQHDITEHRCLGRRPVERGSPFDGRARVGERDLLTDATGLPRDTPVVGDVHPNAGTGREGAEDTVHVDAVNGTGDRGGLPHDHLRGHRR